MAMQYYWEKSHFSLKAVSNRRDGLFALRNVLLTKALPEFQGIYFNFFEITEVGKRVY